MNKFIHGYINSMLSENESIQSEAVTMLEILPKKIIEAGMILKDTGEYRYGSGEANADNLIKRVINSVSMDLRMIGGHRIGLINTTESNLVEQHKTLITQLSMVLKLSMDEVSSKKIASDLADVILTSWFLVFCRPNESKWGAKWV